MKSVVASISTTITFCAIFTVHGCQEQDLTTKNPIIRKAAQEHNNNIPLCALPPELFDHTFDFFVEPSKPLEQSIKNSLALSATCTLLQ